MSTPDRSFEDRIMDAVVAQFFAPQMVQGSTYNPQTGMSEPVLTYMPSPAARVAADIWTAKKDDIVEVLKDRVSVEEIAEKVAEKVAASMVERLTASNRYIGSYDREQAEMQKMVRERIADELARRAIAKMDAESEKTEET